MNLVETDPDLENLYYEKRTSENGLVNIAVYPVMFGWRVRGWVTGENFCHIDWCAGDVQQDVERLYSILLNVLSNRDESKDVLSDLPQASKVKPYFNDDDFVVNVLSKVVAPFEAVKLRNLNELRLSFKRDGYAGIIQ